MVLSEQIRAVSVSPAMVQQRASDLVKSDAQIMLLRARPYWKHGPVRVGDVSVRVLGGVSQLAILDILSSLGAGEQAVLLTDRPLDDLGDAVLARAYRQGIEFPDEWQALPHLFPGALEVGRDLRRISWAATSLLDYQPPGGWPRSPEPALTSRHAVGSLLAHMLTIDAGAQLDGVVLFTELGRREVRAAWASVNDQLRRHLIDWAATELGDAAALALQIVARNEHITPLAVGLVTDVLWPGTGTPPAEAQVAARVRIERFIDRRAVSIDGAKALAGAARATVLRLEGDNSSELGLALQQAEKLFDDVEWPEGAERSAVLRAGYSARVRLLASALTSGVGVEDALTGINEHRDAALSIAPTMAVRLHRWLATAEDSSTSLGSDLQRQLSDGAWVDAAVGAVWTGSDDVAVRKAYRSLLNKVHERRKQRDRVVASRLDQVNRSDGEGALGVERLLAEVVAPWRRPSGVLLVVLDGMSAAIATALAAEVGRMGLVEWVPSATQQRQSVVAALPSLTNVSRTSLFCGEVRSGVGDDEKRGLATAFPGAKLFHKNDLRSEGGAALPEAVTEAIQRQAVPVVGVVINAIDDATHKNDTSAQEWDIRSLDPLRALLNAALAAQRTVILTSDHGHVVERTSEALNAVGAESRWRTAVSGAVVDGEVAVSGPRVVAPGGEAVLLWRSDAHYGPRHAGYHGGASLAELAIPVLVFQAAIVTTGADGWEQAAPQVPLWWNDPVNRATSTKIIAEAKPQSRKARKPVQPSQGDGLFEIDGGSTGPTGLVEAVISSATYAEQKQMAGRRALDDSTAGAVLGALVDRGGRAHQDTVAAAAGIAAIDFSQVFAAVRRLLNVDGYGVIELDTDGVTLRLDESLLREQFELGNAR
ncbi:BREX-2 system phosphatase PglZ [Rhodococcus sp. BP-149]|uniref:BREX-2 system phosphatase PglZ n=1 Tax=unclassified Rhodococcus (in: high G+C Gram-positive bacteria) TaxID=192944 RepID=UPI001C9BA995|nr:MULTISPECIES: BREX-2 system phosphatase PglZ [unclassified Rhodococcus (in: high G+C Gram-positive bacteria)]MBY6687225.1 BREX-2 system phosphatase PglZ [Rhodococcus sp. BP-288]MBY6694352.1 BREX-2 system phosphatase PglZ [Rhodococcus sp. BP-188]MBY6698061.1 BREX-2 system phosphatase PglZ [Rhodococcus sp. BP-285]MBY6704281.1 BREX-2 system phosphatase PglZ [Rhodococcus sp. BP-283]MBY6712930.1 BREX-2 system phosphatase PglZ [Rhodococcus sp. BP-160]